MRRVVVTGMGIVSSIGANVQEALASLREARSGITRADRYAELGFRSQVQGAPTVKPEEMLDRRAMRFHGGGTAWCHVAMDQAIRDSGLEPGEVSNERAGLIIGSGGPSTRAIVEAADVARAKGPKRVGPYAVPKSMCSTASATLSTWFKIKGVAYSISSACATSNHCIGAAAEQILLGKQDLMFAGGCEDLDWTLSVLFDAMGAMSSAYNATPERASRAYDKNRDGFVISAGAGVVVLEDYQRAKARGMRLDIAAGTAVRFEPGQTRDVDLVALAGKKTVYGYPKPAGSGCHYEATQPPVADPGRGSVPAARSGRRVCPNAECVHRPALPLRGRGGVHDVERPRTQFRDRLPDRDRWCPPAVRDVLDPRPRDWCKSRRPGIAPAHGGPPLPAGRQRGQQHDLGLPGELGVARPDPHLHRPDQLARR